VTVGALLAAAGIGERLGAGIPKALCTVGGRTLLEHSLGALRAHPAVGPIVVTAPADFASRFVELAASDPAVTVVAGGKTRQDSIRLGLGVLGPEVEIVLVHDAARPFPVIATPARALSAIEAGADGVVPVLPVTDTIKRVAPDGTVVGTVDRAELRAAQTPQGFRRAALAAAHQYARTASLHHVSDDAGLVERHGGRVVVVDGDPRTMKITGPSDLAIAEIMTGTAPVTG
jgi:2-C-methyl-D-erythritol 4-phosphate cytidylyltransferase